MAVAELAKPKKKRFRDTYDNEKAIREYRETGDDAVREEFFEKNEKLCRYIADKYESTGVPKDELLNLALFGMLKGFNSFDLNKGIKFATYGSTCAHNEILMFLRKRKKMTGTASINESINVDWEGNELTLMDVVPSDSYRDFDTVDNTFIVRRMGELANEFLCKPVERAVYNNLTSETKPLTQKELSASLGLSQSYISRIEKKVIKKLRKLAVAEGLIEADEYSGKGVTKALPKVKRPKPEPTTVEQEPTKVYNIRELQKGAGKEMARETNKLDRLQTEKAKKVVYYYIFHPEMTQKAVAEACGFSQPYVSTTYRRLKTLSEKELTSLAYIEPDGSTVEQAVPKPSEEELYATVPEDEVEPKREPIKIPHVTQEQIDKAVRDYDLVVPKALSEKELKDFEKSWEEIKKQTTGMSTISIPEPPKRNAPRKIELNMEGVPANMVEGILNGMAITAGKTYKLYIQLEEEE